MGQSVRRLSLSHFRSHRRMDLTLDDRPVAFFGANGAGKTNVLEAVSLLSPGRGLRRAVAEAMARRPEAVGWKIRAEVAGEEIETAWEGGSGRVVAMNGKTAAQVALGRLVRIVWLVPAMDRLWIEGAEGRRRFLDRLALSFEPRHGEAVLAYEKAMRERNRLLKDGGRDIGWYSALEAQMAEAGAAICAVRQNTVAQILAAQDGASTEFPMAALRLIAPEGRPAPETVADLATAWAEGRRADMAAGRTLIGPHRADLEAEYVAKAMPAREVSTGEQKALLLSLVLAHARALTSAGSPPVVLLDEVAAHLDRDRRAALYEEILGLGVQAWMTGTGGELFEDCGDRIARYCVVAGETGSEVTYES